MNEKVGVTANWRGKVGVASERQPEVADVPGCVFGLRLGAQDDLIDDVGVRRPGGFLQDAVEVARLDDLSLGQLEAEACEEGA